jgi:hypothetical protein
MAFHLQQLPLAENLQQVLGSVPRFTNLSPLDNNAWLAGSIEADPSGLPPLGLNPALLWPPALTDECPKAPASTVGTRLGRGRGRGSGAEPASS